MYLDKLNQLSEAQALAATAYSTNTYDSGAALNDISIGEPLALFVKVDVAADFTTTDETYEIQLVQSANANLSSHDVLVSKVVLAADLALGDQVVLPLPPGSKSKQYLGARFVLGGTSPSVTLSAYLQPQNMIQNYKPYPDNIEIA
jgi:hypothetical protein